MKWPKYLFPNYFMVYMAIIFFIMAGVEIYIGVSK